MRILFFGTSPFALPVLQSLVDHRETMVGVVTQPDRPAGRGGKLTPPPVKELAVALELPVLQPESCRAPEFLDTVRELAPELSVVVAYGQFLPDTLLSIPPCGSVNLHGSLLPKYRGAAPIQRAIMAGEERTGVCLMWMVREMDAGDVIACAETPILPEDNAGTLSERLSAQAAALLIDWLPALARGEAPHHPQDPSQVTFAPAIRKEERDIDWSQPAEAIWRQIRALAPAPAAITTFRKQPLKVLAAEVTKRISTEHAGIPGEIVEIQGTAGPVVATGDGYLLLLTVHPAGKRPLSAAEFCRGYRVAAGERFGSDEED
ncbi:MAG: methionyl-tRNA formyltransferase [Armatimonadota bacterium]